MKVRYSVTKSLLALTFFAFGALFLFNIQGTSSTYFGLFRSDGLQWFVQSIGVLCIVFAALITPFAVRALLNRPALELDKDRLRARVFSSRSYDRRVATVTVVGQHVVVQAPGERATAVPLIFVACPRKLKAFLSAPC
jgi:cytochrome c biogenesis protein CcdA